MRNQPMLVSSLELPGGNTSGETLAPTQAPATAKALIFAEYVADRL